MTNELVARFRQVALQRIERVEQEWNRLVQGSVAVEVPQELRRELHTLKGEAEVIGFDDVSLVCRKLEALARGAERVVPRVPRELDLMVMMGFRFVVLLARPHQGRELAGIDLAGFVRQVDEVLADLERAPALAAPPPVARQPRPTAPPADRASPASRRRLGRAAVLAFIESARATGSTREHLREVWRTLADELSTLGAVPLAPRVHEHVRRIGEQARNGRRELAVAVDLPDDLRFAPEVADAVDGAFRQLLGGAVAGTLTVRWEETAGEGAITLVVEHGGAGIDPGDAFGAVRAALVAVGGDVAIRTAEGQGTGFRLRAPRAASTLAVHAFTACGGLDLRLAVPASWTVAPIDGSPVAADPLAALVPDPGYRAPTDGFALRLTRGRFDLCWRAVGPVCQATAVRIGAPADDQPAEVVRIDGREVLLLRPELS